jgi:hypothetical protein
LWVWVRVHGDGAGVSRRRVVRARWWLGGGREKVRRGAGVMEESGAELMLSGIG